MGARRCAAAELLALRRMREFYTDLHLAPGSRRTYATGVRAYTRFSLYFRRGLPVFPATDRALEDFVTFQSQTCAYSTLKTYLYGVREYHLSHGFDFPPLAERVPVYWTLKGIHRVHGRGSRPKQALTLEILNDIHRHLTSHGPLQGDSHTVWTAMLAGMFGLLRKDNLTAGKARAARPGLGVRRGDVLFRQQPDGAEVAWLRIRSSKTNQMGERVHLVPYVAIGGHLCPVGALKQHFAAVRGAPDAALFMLRPKGGRRPLPMSHTFLVSSMKSMLRASGHDPTQFAGHSLRRGGATLAFQLGVARQLIQMHGDWLSDVVDRYHEVDHATRLLLPFALARHAGGLRA